MNYQQLISLLDFTRLIENDEASAIESFCQKALTPFGPVAAVCVYPEFVATARKTLQGTGIKLATVANFPAGNETLSDVAKTIQDSLEEGADEIDVVMPYQCLIKDEEQYVENYLKQCRELSKNHTLKVIIESGELTQDQVIKATHLVVNSGADFVKTSTGKAPIGATLEACEAILSVLSQYSDSPGIKLSGGVNTPEQAQAYLDHIIHYKDEPWITPAHVRFGASRLLDACLIQP